MLIVVKLNQQQREFRVFTPFPRAKCNILNMRIKNLPENVFPINYGFRALLVKDIYDPYEMFLLDSVQPNDSFYKMDYMPAYVPHEELKKLHKKGYQEMYVNATGFPFDKDDEITMLLEIDHK